jgi:hypothetical protein
MSDSDCIPGGCFNGVCLGAIDVPSEVTCTGLICGAALGCTPANLQPGSFVGPTVAQCSTSSSNSFEVLCDAPSDCSSGEDCCDFLGFSQTCVPRNAQNTPGSGCATLGDPMAGKGANTLCDPKLPSPNPACPAGTSCTAIIGGFICV